MAPYLSIAQPEVHVTVKGEYLAAYRIAAMAFFKLDRFEDCDEHVRHYDVMFSSTDDNIQITFMTPSVDPIKFRESREYAQEVIKKGRNGSTVVVNKKEMKVISIYKAR
jgi:type IV secretory pathway VirB4 component